MMSTVPQIVLGTKGETLARLAPILTRSYIMPHFLFTVAEWRADKEAVLRRIRDAVGTEVLIVRSSARTEDTMSMSNAGAFLSVAGVDGRNKQALAQTIDAVISSYDGVDFVDQVLVQQQLLHVRLSGVLFTRDITNLSPYFIFNYDAYTGSTGTVTSGKGNNLSTYVRFRGAKEPFPNENIGSVFAAVEEIESLVGDRLEIELAVDREGKVCIFQVRSLVHTAGVEPTSEETLGDWLTKVAKKVEKLSRPHPHLHGTRSVFGVMPDWNPAEIIGLKPRALALTLYKEIITDSIWAYMRDNYGYRNLRSFPLMVSLLGVPYIDVRVSFNSFVPKGVREALSQKLVNYYIDRLVESPQAHDKVEFDIVFSCYYPGIRHEITRLEHHGFSGTEVGEILSALRDLTNCIIRPDGFWLSDLEKIETLKMRQRQVLESPMSVVDKIYWLLEDCKRFGTLPFCGLARAGFIAVQFLKGFVKTGIWTSQEYEDFLASLDTVTNRMRSDVMRLQRGEISWETFLATYGHLRPGTYDILSRRYDEDFDRYFGGESPLYAERLNRPFMLSATQQQAIQETLDAEGLTLSPPQLFAFIRAGIEGREYAKLVFTRSVSDALVQLESLGRQCGLTRDDLSYLNIRTVLQLYSTLDARDLRDVLLRDIEANREAYAVTQAVRLPEVILSPSDVFHFHTGAHKPNFITSRKVIAEVVREDAIRDKPIAGKVVCVCAADPGYDWIFSKGIAALVTQFGGANSHMAIRAAEAGIPAVIGCGEQNFAVWSTASYLEIDCGNQTVRVLR